MPAVRTRRPRSASPIRRRIGILVIGMHRSGTSAVTRTLNLMGAALPENLMPAAPDNIAGFWESADIMAVHDRFLAAIGSAWDDPRPLSLAAFATPAATTCHDDLLAVLHRDLADAPVFAIKDPRCCRLLPLWRNVMDAFGAAPVAVLPVRNPLEAALSLRLRNGLGRERALAMWLAHTLAGERGSRDWRRLFVRYDAFLADPVAAARQLAKWLDCFPESGVAAALEAIDGFWSAELRHHQFPDSTVDDPAIPSWVRGAYGWMVEAAAGAEPGPEVIEALATALDGADAVYGPLIGLPERELRQSILALEGQVGEWRDRASQAWDARAAAEQALHQAREQVAGLSGERGLLGELVERMRADHAELSGRAGAADGELARSRADRADLAEKLATLGGALERERADHAASRGRAGALDGELERSRADRAELAGRLSAVEDQLRRSREDAAELAERLSGAADDLERSRSDKRDLADRLSAADGAVARVRADNAEMTDRLSALEGELERARGENAGLTADRANLSDALAATRDQSDRREAGLLEAERTRGELERTRAALAAQTEDLANKVRRSEFAVAALAGIATGLHGMIPLARRLGGLARAALCGRLRRRLAEDHDIDTIARSGLFDVAYYFRRYPDVAAARVDPIVHYVRSGAREGRDPHPEFDTRFYRSAYADLARAGGNPLAHYARFGAAEGRLPNHCAAPFGVVPGAVEPLLATRLFGWSPIAAASADRGDPQRG